ncbi:MAG TPA: endonuclease/exonuclease/phosphatase family protein [Gemmatimonadales bacterium]|nr:endonuclease/exonuclease/phosphatase family protein [Gemmatimonadales bacterium]
MIRIATATRSPPSGRLFGSVRCSLGHSVPQLPVVRLSLIAMATATNEAPGPTPGAIAVTPWRGVEGHDRLEAWRANVGAPVALDCATADPRPAVTELVVLSWNLWIGRGRLADVVARIRSETDAAIVILAQEAYRSDATVPVRAPGRAARRAAGGFPPRARPRADIVEAADTLGFNLRYVPSMRNGTGRSDRGNAILSELPLSHAWAFELPLVLQRRVPLAATLLLAGGPVHVVSAHLDPRGQPGATWLGVQGRAKQTTYLLEQLGGDVVVLGADLNLGRGRRERSWRLLHHAEFTSGVPAVTPGWRHTFHAVPRLVLDYVLVRDRVGRVAGARVERLDEHPLDRGPTVFGSDHHPLMAHVRLHVPEEERA